MSDNGRSEDRGAREVGWGLWRRVVRLALLALVIGGMALYVAHHQATWRAVGRVSLRNVALLVALWAAMYVGTSLTQYAVFRALAVALHPVECLALPVAQTLSNYLLPFRGGAAVAAVYLKKRHGLTYARFVACFLTIYAVFILTSGPVACLLLGFVALRGGAWHPRIFGLFLLLTVVCGAAWATVQHWPLPGGRLGRVAQRVTEGWCMLRSERGLIVKVMAITWARMVVNGLRIYVAFRSVGAPIGLAECCLAGIVLQYSIFFSLLPGNVGVQEGLIVLCATVLGCSSELGAAAALLLRGVGLVMVFALGPFSLWILARRTGESV